MKKSRFSEEQIIGILKEQQAGLPVAGICHHHGIAVHRSLLILLRRERLTLNHKKLFRLYRDERLSVRKRGGRKRALGTRAPATVPQEANQRWSLDLLSDTLDDGRRFRILVVVDDCTRECLALVVDPSLSGQRVAHELDRIVAGRGQAADDRLG